MQWHWRQNLSQSHCKPFRTPDTLSRTSPACDRLSPDPRVTREHRCGGERNITMQCTREFKMQTKVRWVQPSTTYHSAEHWRVWNANKSEMGAVINELSQCSAQKSLKFKQRWVGCSHQWKSTMQSTEEFEMQTKVRWVRSSTKYHNSNHWRAWNQGWAFFIAIYCESNILHRLETSENIAISEDITIFLRYFSMHDISHFRPYMDQLTIAIH